MEEEDYEIAWKITEEITTSIHKHLENVKEKKAGNILFYVFATHIRTMMDYFGIKDEEKFLTGFLNAVIHIKDHINDNQKIH